MDGENNGKPENLLKMHDLGGFPTTPIFGLTPKSSRLEFSGSLTVMIHQKILTANNPLKVEQLTLPVERMRSFYPN